MKILMILISLSIQVDQILREMTTSKNLHMLRNIRTQTKEHR